MKPTLKSDRTRKCNQRPKEWYLVFERLVSSLTGPVIVRESIVVPSQQYGIKWLKVHWNELYLPKTERRTVHIGNKLYVRIMPC